MKNWQLSNSYQFSLKDAVFAQLTAERRFFVFILEARGAMIFRFYRYINNIVQKSTKAKKQKSKLFNQKWISHYLATLSFSFINFFFNLAIPAEIVKLKKSIYMLHLLKMGASFGSIQHFHILIEITLDIILTRRHS